MHATHLDAIRTFEGFAPQARWDYAQFTNGYGTRALYPGEVIDRAEADRRFQSEIANARAVVERHASRLDEGTKAALTSLTYNAGDSWVRSGLGEAVLRGDLDEVRSIFQQYNKAGGEVLPGLVSRRAAEALWIGDPALVGAGPAASANVDDLPSQENGSQVAAAATLTTGGATPPTQRSMNVPPTSAEARIAKLISVVSESSAGARSVAAALPGPSSLSDVARLVMLDMGYDLLAHRSERERDRQSVRDV